MSNNNNGVASAQLVIAGLHFTNNMTSTTQSVHNYVPDTDITADDFHCSRGALTDSFGWLIQAILAALAFALLILKRFCEPKRQRRLWIIWFYDTSKQLVGSLVIHFANVFLAGIFNGDPCTWYIVSFLLDSSVGLLVIYIGIRTCQWIAAKKGWNALNFGEYGKPPLWQAWLGQCAMYIFLMIIEKIFVTVIIQFPFWDQVRQLILSPIKDPKVELAVVMLIIPFILNALIFWVVDNFLMHRRRKVKDESFEEEVSGNHQGSRYKKRDQISKSESETLLIDDEEILNLAADSCPSQLRHSVNNVQS